MTPLPTDDDRDALTRAIARYIEPTYDPAHFIGLRYAEADELSVGRVPEAIRALAHLIARFDRSASFDVVTECSIGIGRADAAELAEGRVPAVVQELARTLTDWTDEALRKNTAKPVRLAGKEKKP